VLPHIGAVVHAHQMLCLRQRCLPACRQPAARPPLQLQLELLIIGNGTSASHPN
jgi:hypothetical protein